MLLLAPQELGGLLEKRQGRVCELFWGMQGNMRSWETIALLVIIQVKYRIPIGKQAASIHMVRIQLGLIFACLLLTAEKMSYVKCLALCGRKC